MRIFSRILGSSRINLGAGFLRIFTVAFVRLFYVRLGKLRLYDYPTGLEPLQGLGKGSSVCQSDGYCLFYV